MKELEVGEVYTFKLFSGEEVVSKVSGFGSTTIELKDPLCVAPNAQGMGLMPALFTADHGKIAVLNTSAVAMWAPSAEPIRVKYIEATTGIATASKKIVLG